MKLSTNPQLETAYQFVQNTNRHVFLTGKAGTGKTTFLTELRKQSSKRMVVVAPTGVAAINAGGVTIHSFFQISFGPQLPDTGQGVLTEPSSAGNPQKEIKRLSRDKISIIRSLDLLVIDEISMVRADLLDAVDESLRRFRSHHIPFGGVQLLMIGDLQQLAPVVKDDEWKLLGKYYDTPFFFGSRALQKSEFITIELTEIFRQSNRHFIDILNRIRNNEADSETLSELNSRYRPDFDPDDKEGYIRLTTHNQQAKNVNLSHIEKLKGPNFHFSAEITGDFPELSFPTEQELTLKRGAQVMFVKNDISPEKRYFNGKIGTITAIDENSVTVMCPGETEPIEVEPAEWQNIKYKIDETSREISEEFIGSFTQYPLKLAWAITIHKSQGLTFDKAIIDAYASFAHGQVYVALSRCRSLEGLVLSSTISPASIRNDLSVRAFSQKATENPPTEEDLEKAKNDYLRYLVSWQFDFHPLRSRIVNFMKVWEENKGNCDGNPGDWLPLMVQSLDGELIPVSEKFVRQLEQIIAFSHQFDSDPVLLDRLSKAGTWFTEKLGTLLVKPLGETSFTTDNREIRNKLDDSLKKIADILYPLSECMKVCLTGFSAAAFTAARAKAFIVKPDFIRGTKGSGPSGPPVKNHPDLYRILDNWRYAKAKESKKEPYQILPHKTITEIAGELPVTQRRMKSIKGLSKKKWKLFGKELLAIVINYCMEQGIDLSEINIPGEDESKKKTESKKISLEMFESGKSVRKIAMERALTESTIEGHLAFYVAEGILMPDRLVPPEKIKLIAGYLQQHPSSTVGEAKAELGDHCSYGEIRIIRAYMERSEANNNVTV